MKRSEINEYIRAARQFFEANRFFLPLWADWSPEVWAGKGKECAEIGRNQLGWDVTDFGGSDFRKEGLTLFTVRNGNALRDRKVYCEKIMFVQKMQVTPIHFHWKKMEDIINRGGGMLCMKLWKADGEERQSSEECTVKIDGIATRIAAGEVLRLRPGQSITFEPRMYHTFWAEEGDCMVGEVSAVNDDAADNRFLEEQNRFPRIDEDEPAAFCLCNEYPVL